jgi:polynucleotide 5'-kinase involved in rRNA processing
VDARKFPLLHKSILNSAWARRHLFAHLAALSTRVEVPQHYIPHAVSGPGLVTTAPLHLDESHTSLAALFQVERQVYGGRSRVLLIGRSGSGKSVLLRYLLRVTAQRFLHGEAHQLPLLVDLRTAPLTEGGNEASPQQAAGYHKEGHCL